MSLENAFPILFAVVFAGVALTFIVKIFKHGGFKAALFGASIRRTVGEVAGGGPKMMSIVLKVHSLGDPPEKAVGLEVVTKSFASYNMMPVTLSASQASELAKLLESAKYDVGAT